MPAVWFSSSIHFSTKGSKWCQWLSSYLCRAARRTRHSSLVLTLRAGCAISSVPSKCRIGSKTVVCLFVEQCQVVLNTIPTAHTEIHQGGMIKHQGSILCNILSCEVSWLPPVEGYCFLFTSSWSPTECLRNNVTIVMSSHILNLAKGYFSPSTLIVYQICKESHGKEMEERGNSLEKSHWILDSEWQCVRAIIQ